MLPPPIYCSGPKLINAYWWSRGWSEMVLRYVVSLAKSVVLHLHIHDVLIG